MRKVEQGNYVKLHYTGKFENGDVFDSSHGCQPLEVHVGSSEVIPGFENAIVGMTPNEKKTFSLEATDAYGARDEGLQRDFPRSDFPQSFQPEAGQVIVLENPEQGHFPATVKSVSEESILLDLNHPLAGKSLTFEVEVVEINDQPSPSSCGCGCSCS